MWTASGKIEIMPFRAVTSSPNLDIQKQLCVFDHRLLHHRNAKVANLINNCTSTSTQRTTQVRTCIFSGMPSGSHASGAKRTPQIQQSAGHCSSVCRSSSARSSIRQVLASSHFAVLGAFGCFVIVGALAVWCSGCRAPSGAWCLWVPGVPAGCSRAPWQASVPGAGRLWVFSARGCLVLRAPDALGCLVLAGALAAWRSGCPAPSGTHCSRALVNIMAINHVLDRCACTPAHCSHGTLVCTAPGGGPRPRGKSCAMVREPWSWHTPWATRCSPASTRRSRPHLISLLLTDLQGVRPRRDIQRPSRPGGVDAEVEIIPTVLHFDACQATVALA